MPARRASASTAVSTRRRTRITPRAGLVTRSVSASATPAAWSTDGPSTTAYSPGCTSRCRRSCSRPGTMAVPEPTADCSASADAASTSTMTVMGSALEQRRERDGRAGTDLRLVVEQTKGELTVVRGEDDLLRLVLGQGQRQQGLRQLLGRRRTGLVGGRRAQHARGADPDDLHRRDEQL